MNNDNLKIGTVVVLKNQEQNLRKGTLVGGVVKAIGDTYILIYRNNIGFVTVRRDGVNILNPDDLDEEGIEII